ALERLAVDRERVDPADDHASADLPVRDLPEVPLAEELALEVLLGEEVRDRVAQRDPVPEQSERERRADGLLDVAELAPARRVEERQHADLRVLRESTDALSVAERDREHRQVARAEVVLGPRILEEDDLLLDVGAVEAVLLEREGDRLERRLLGIHL